MMGADMKFTRKNSDGSLKSFDNLAGLFNNWKEKETWLFLAPHDDDIVIGAGKTLLAALAAGVDVHAVITTDGAMGYCSLEQKHTVSKVREEECFNSFLELGLPKENIHFLHFPDCDLWPYRGRSFRTTGHPSEIAGASGLQNAYVYILRKIRPTRVFVPTITDLHPDHQIVHQEMLISLFHSTGEIWPELGDVLGAMPDLYEYATYCDFVSLPELRIEISDELLEKKWAAIRAYKSQLQIEQLVEEQKKGGNIEFIREMNFSFYSIKECAKKFEENSRSAFCNKLPDYQN